MPQVQLIFSLIFYGQTRPLSLSFFMCELTNHLSSSKLNEPTGTDRFLWCNFMFVVALLFSSSVNDQTKTYIRFGSNSGQKSGRIASSPPLVTITLSKNHIMSSVLLSIIRSNVNSIFYNYGKHQKMINQNI